MHDHASEAATLGAVLLHPGTLDRVLDVGLTAEAFHHPGHRALFLAMQAVAPAIDLVRLQSELDAGSLRALGGISYLAALSGRCPSIQAAPEYAAKVLQQKARRDARDALQDGLSALDEGDDASEVCKAVSDRLDASQVAGVAQDWSAPEDAANDLLDALQNPRAADVIRTGYPDLDARLGGLHRGDLTIVAGRPSMGKTAFAVNVGDAVARSGGVVGMFSLEMSERKLWVRRVASRASVNSMRIRDHLIGRGLLRDDHVAAAHTAIFELAREPFYVDDRGGASLAYVEAKCRVLKRRTGALDVVLIDYLQLMTGTGKEGNREQEISGLSRGLKGLAKNLDCHVVALSQLNRSLESRADKRPMMSDLRESGAIEQDADNIVFMYRDVVYNEKTDDKEAAEAIVRKQRDGTTGPVWLKWRAPYVRFESRPEGWRP